MSAQKSAEILVCISADAEWNAVLDYFQSPSTTTSPFGSYFHTKITGRNVVLFQGGWGKISAAASTQFAIDTWHPHLLINLGTCGGFEGQVKQGEILLVTETLVYDIHERMGDPEQALRHYRTSIELSFLSQPYPQAVRLSRLVSADQDIDPASVRFLSDNFNAIAADWESGAIAWTAQRNQTRLLILRGVSDLVNFDGGEVYDNQGFAFRAREIMVALLDALPGWIECAYK